MRIPLVGGRAFDEGDAAGAERVCVVNEALARKYFPGEDPLGRYVRGEGGTPEAQLKRIVGVVGDVRHNLDEDPKPEIYFPEAQDASRSMVLVARADADPLSLAPAVRAQVQALDRDLPVYNVRTMDQVRAESIFRQRFSVVLLGIFAALALALASVGLYGVISYTVTQRTHEIGVRMALGAQGGDVLRMVVRQGMAHVAVGVGAGLAGSLLLTRVMAGLLYGVSATDPATFAGVSLLLAAVALAACLVPARRAAKVDPIKALRYE
jgi:putative ABC transport system permease protein